jgi:quinol monooxygenase YgiN
MIVVHTTIPLDPDGRAEFEERVAALVEHSRSEPGTLRYHAARDVADPTLLHFFERYEDAAAAEAHTDSEPYRRFVEALPSVAAGSIETTQFETDDVETVEFDAETAVDALD